MTVTATLPTGLRERTRQLLDQPTLAAAELFCRAVRSEMDDRLLDWDGTPARRAELDATLTDLLGGLTGLIRVREKLQADGQDEDAGRVGRYHHSCLNRYEVGLLLRDVGKPTAVAALDRYVRDTELPADIVD